MLKQVCCKCYSILILSISFFVISSCNLFQLNGIKLEKITIEFFCNSDSILLGKNFKILQDGTWYSSGKTKAEQIIINNNNTVTLEHIKDGFFDHYNENTNLNTLKFQIYIMEINDESNDITPSEVLINLSKKSKKNHNLIHKETKSIRISESESLELNFTVYYGYGGWY